MRCGYCYNKEIVYAKSAKISFDDVLHFLDTRINLLDAVVLSGGEATGVDLMPFCIEARKRGFKIKLDTNGINFEHIKELVSLHVVDYVALDYKAPKYKFESITKLPSKIFDIFAQTLDYLISSDVDFEVRTTIHRDLLDENDINLILDDLYKRDYIGMYFLQSFLETTNNIADIKKSKIDFDFELIKEKNDKITVQYRS